MRKRCAKTVCSGSRRPIIAVEADLAVQLSPSETQVARWCKHHSIGLVVVGPEAPLVAGMVDQLQAAGIRSACWQARAAATQTIDRVFLPP